MTKQEPMDVAKEVYKGIEFVRISSLPTDQRKLFWQTFDHKKIIKILKSDSLLNDCVPITDFLVWQSSLPAGRTTVMASALVQASEEASSTAA